MIQVTIAEELNFTDDVLQLQQDHLLYNVRCKQDILIQVLVCYMGTPIRSATRSFHGAMRDASRNYEIASPLQPYKFKG
eukprot:scaffold6413_cov149-Skeletonema_dohrnii-CCMP3373.AAC.8